MTSNGWEEIQLEVCTYGYREKQTFNSWFSTFQIVKWSYIDHYSKLNQ